MMFLSLLKFEFRYLSRQLSWWLGLVMLTAFGFFLSGKVVASGNVLALSPHNLTYAMTFVSQIAIFTTTLITANSALRDTQYDFIAFVKTKPVNNIKLMLSRFVSLYVMSLVIVLSAVTAMLLPVLLTDYDPEIYGYFDVSYILWPIAVVVLPNLLFTASLLFASACVFNTTIMTFVSGISIYVFYLLSAALLDSPMFTGSDPLARGEINYASLFDPFAVSAFLEQSQYWTTIEKNTLLVKLTDNFLYNRLIWLMASLLLLTGLGFQPFSKLKGKVKGYLKRKNEKNANCLLIPPATKTENTEQSIDGGYQPQTPTPNLWVAFKAFVMLELRMTLRGTSFILLFVLIALLTLAQVINGMENNFFVGVQHAYTSSLLPYMTKPLEVIGLFVVVFFSGEMIWRAKDIKFDGVVGVVPTPSWLSFISQIVVMACITFLMFLVTILIALGYQISSGFTPDNLHLYLAVIGLEGLPLLLMAILCLSIQSISLNKYVGFVITAGILLVFKTDVATLIGVDHNLLRFTDTGPHHYSDFSGYDFYSKSSFWFVVYWTLVTTCFALVCYVLSKRTIDESLLAATKRFTSLSSKFEWRGLQLTLSSTVLVGSFVFYNTNILNPYLTKAQAEQNSLSYELEFKQYKQASAPKISDVYVEVDFYPTQHKVSINGHYWLANQSDEYIQNFLISLPNPEQAFEFSLDQGSISKVHDELNVVEVKLNNALPPEGKVKLNFTTRLAKIGFKNADKDISLLTNGSYFHGSSLLPFIGYDSAHEIQNDDIRIEYGLAKKDSLPALVEGKEYNLHGHEKDASWINFEAVMSTQIAQTAIAPGELQNQWQENNRAYFHYKVNQPMSNFLGFASAQYQIKSIQPGNTAINAYYLEQHDKNIELMLNTAAKSLQYFEREFGEYPYPELNLVEIPNRGFARAYPATIYISEHVGFKEKIPLDSDSADLDNFSYLIAHEVAHQWWGHQLASAKTEGEVLLIESLADYSALMVMKEIYGDDYVKQVLQHSTQQYLIGRSSDHLGETPLFKMLGQRYLRYHKGPVVFNAIRQLMGEGKLNQALKKLLEQKGSVKSNYATSLDLVANIKALATEQHKKQIEEWLTEIVTYELSIRDSYVEPLANGKYKVTVNVSGLTIKQNTPVQQSPLDFVHTVTLAVYSEVLGELYLLKQQAIQMINGQQQVELILDTEPSKLVLDPDYLFIDRNRINNEQRLGN
ncbi:M1 family aminopeptidase [Psychrosphaera aquimarina]|uniref:M1 family aminopeptidase n=1 Tax=Psychrosphaera aquimarina TaxID=2044854 RepID=A0ABU3R199_9GAMM|nr:M1 family aminopeptidase [Psychrosphaera aquimarina]MDU0113447.1 M1 family aminopeptidase [Psychrosphaera aquimarina]